MEVIFVADQIPEERQWALILVAGGDEAYNRWDTLEDTVQDRKKVEQVWMAFEKSFKQSTSFWHFRDTYLADFRQDKSETTADLDLRIKQTVRGCQWQKESEEERMIDLLYHATIYYEIRKFVQESDPTALTYEMVIEKAKAHERNVLEYKDHQASHGGANSVPSYNNPLLSAHALSKRWPSGRGNNGQHCGKCGKSHERGNCPEYGHLLIDVKDKVTKKYHPIRFYVMNTDVARILISHAASYWLGLVRVLCDNKAPRIKRQVASIDKKSDFQAKSGHFRTSTSNSASSSQKKQTTPKTVTSGASNIPSPRMHIFEDAKLQTRKKATGVRPGRDVDVSDGEQHSQDEAPATIGKEPKTSKQGNSVHSGPNKKITDRVKDGPFSNKTGNNSNAKSGPKMKDTSKKAPRRKYYRPSNDTKTFQINNKGHLQCLQDPKLIHKPNDKGKLPGSREAPIYHEPGTVSCKTVEDLKKLYPNSFDRLGSLKGAYNIRIDPSVKPATHARRKVPIESKEAIDRELDYLIEEEIITEQVEPTPWVSSVTFPRKPNGDIRVCLDPSNLNKAIIREHHKPMTVEEIAHELAGATVYTKADALKAFLQIHLTHEASLLTTFNSHRGRLRFLRMPFGAKMSQDVFQLWMDAILEQCPGVIGIHDDMVIFGVDQEDHDANLINLLNICQKEGLVLNSKKLEL